MLTLQRFKKATLVTTVVSIGVLAFSIMVFAAGDTTPHNQSNTHVHRDSHHHNNYAVQWSVSVGKINRSSVATYVWHKVVVRNNTNAAVVGEWEWQHIVTGNTGWNDEDKYVTSINLTNDSLTRQGWSSVDLPTNRPGMYHIDAYTRVSLTQNNQNITTEQNQRDIISVEFPLG